MNEVVENSRSDKPGGEVVTGNTWNHGSTTKEQDRVKSPHPSIRSELAPEKVGNWNKSANEEEPQHPAVSAARDKDLTAKQAPHGVTVKGCLLLSADHIVFGVVCANIVNVVQQVSSDGWRNERRPNTRTCK